MKIFLNDLPGIAKLCSVSVENNVVDPNAVNLREGKWLMVLTLVVIFTLGICIKKRKTLKKMGSFCCGGCWTRCRKRDSDGGERDSLTRTSYCCVNPEARTFNQTIELRDIPAPKKPRRSGKLEARNTVQNTGMISETLAHRFMKQKEDVESPWNQFYQPDPEPAQRYLEEKAAVSVNQRNARDVPRVVTSPSTPNLYPRVPVLYE